MNIAGGKGRRAAWGAALLATTALAVSAPATAQGQQPASPPPPAGSTSIGPDGLRNFSLQPQRRIVTPPAPTATPPAVTPPPTPNPPPAAPTPQPALQNVSRTVPNPPTTRAAPQPSARAPATPAAPTPQAAVPAPQIQPAPADDSSSIQTPPPALTGEAPAPVAPVKGVTPSPQADGYPLWMYALGIAMLALAAFLLLRRRRTAQLALPMPEDETDIAEQPVPQPSVPRVPRPDPVPRPWIELELVAERATADAQESFVEFALTVRNSGGSAARNLKLQAKLICGTLTQDEEIAAFQRKKPGEHRTIALPDLAAGEEITIQGRVDSKGEELKALRVEQKLLFIPLVVVNAHYDWNSSRSGQTSKSFLVGREKSDPAERMAPFRLDLGPRVYRTVGQRPYKIQRRV